MRKEQVAIKLYTYTRSRPTLVSKRFLICAELGICVTSSVDRFSAYLSLIFTNYKEHHDVVGNMREVRVLLQRCLGATMWQQKGTAVKISIKMSSRRIIDGKHTVLAINKIIFNSRRKIYINHIYN